MTSTSRHVRVGTLVTLYLLAAMVARAAQRDANDDHEREGRYCSQTASALAQACGYERQDAYWLAVAKCINLEDDNERAACYLDAAVERRDKATVCRAQFVGRQAACERLGQDRFDPDLDANDFERDYANPGAINRYFPLRIGARWTFAGPTEVATLEILNRTKLVDGVTCVVVRDSVFRNGDLSEDTEDWYAQAKNGDVWYCGEEVKDYDTFDGDRPRKPELVKIDGSFKAGRNGDKAGVIFKAAPKAGDAYREEFSLGNAEDVSEVLSTTYTFGKSADLDRFVPAALAKLFCDGDCVVTKNYNLLEPGVSARKYYAPGVGFFLETKQDAISVQLVSCTLDSRCASLPKP